jgi:endonuclease/exonuclease/phosphatase family metal-dependent hydrolase
VSAVSIATWNCFGMAQRVLDALTAVRAPHPERFRDPEVSSAFAVAHIVCVQEILSRDAELFFDALGRERVRDENRLRFRPLSLRGSGLGIASHFAIADTGAHTFSRQGAGWDRFARKGTLYARLSIDGVAVDVLNVHLQSGYDPAHIAIRNAQLAEVTRRIEELGARDRWFIVCGDFNVCGLGANGSDYARLREMLPAFEDLGARDDLPTFDPHPERNSLAHYMEPRSPCQRLDYIFVRPPTSGAIRVQSVIRVLDRPLAATKPPPRMRGAFASDHFALVATISL